MAIEYKIKLLIPDDAKLYAESVARNHTTNGVGDTPLFEISSRRDHFNIESCARAHEIRWATPVELPGWGRHFGLWTSSNQIIGSIAFSSDRLPPNMLHRIILGLGLEPEARANGWGTKLMHHGLSWLKENTSVAWVDLGVFAENAPARRLYEKFGFIESGRMTDAFRYDGHSIDDIQMSLRLSQFEP